LRLVVVGGKSTAVLVVPLANRRRRAQELTDELVADLCRHVAEGNYNIIACHLCGINERTFYDWLKRGAADDDADLETPYSRLAQSLKAAKAVAQSRMVKVIQTKAVVSGDAIAATIFLERTDPEHWGRRERKGLELQPGQERITVTRIEVVRDAPGPEAIE
jgi:hypothetical protein